MSRTPTLFLTAILLLIALLASPSRADAGKRIVGCYGLAHLKGLSRSTDQLDHSGEPIEKGSLRVVLGCSVECGSQTRATPINVLPQYVAAVLGEPDCATEIDGFEEALRANSRGVEAEAIDALLEEIGPLR